MYQKFLSTIVPRLFTLPWWISSNEQVALIFWIMLRCSPHCHLFSLFWKVFVNGIFPVYDNFSKQISRAINADPTGRFYTQTNFEPFLTQNLYKNTVYVYYIYMYIYIYIYIYIHTHTHTFLTNLSTE